MAKLEISEFSTINAWGLLAKPALVQAGIEIAGASAQSAAFQSTIIRFTPREDCRIAVGADPTATAASEFFPKGVTETRQFAAGEKLAVILA